jgi:hypothetical protein
MIILGAVLALIFCAQILLFTHIFGFGVWFLQLHISDFIFHTFFPDVSSKKLQGIFTAPRFLGAQLMSETNFGELRCTIKSFCARRRAPKLSDVSSSYVLMIPIKFKHCTANIQVNIKQSFSIALFC